jgi:hypothetical protein
MTSCSVIQTYQAMNRKEVIVERISFKDKVVLLVPMTHIGEPVFYRSLKDSILFWKNQDYKIYYEQVERRFEQIEVDSLMADTLFRKWRNIRRGNTATKEQYSQLNESLEGKIVQPSWETLGVDSNDVNADITIKKIISLYEEKYGSIMLSDCDMQTPLDEKYACKNNGIANDIMPIILDYRNHYVAHLLDQSIDKKIVVVYGALHIKGIKKILKSNALSG